MIEVESRRLGGRRKLRPAAALGFTDSEKVAPRRLTDSTRMGPRRVRSCAAAPFACPEPEQDGRDRARASPRTSGRPGTSGPCALETAVRVQGRPMRPMQCLSARPPDAPHAVPE